MKTFLRDLKAVLELFGMETEAELAAWRKKWRDK